MDGSEIRTLRKRLGLTQEEFAHQIGVTFATVNRWENRKSKPSRLAVRMLDDLSRKSQAAARKAKAGRSAARRRRRSR